MSNNVLIERYGDKKKLASEGTKNALAKAQEVKSGKTETGQKPDTITLEPDVQITNSIR